jgi:hypothetical protein
LVFCAGCGLLETIRSWNPLALFPLGPESIIPPTDPGRALASSLSSRGVNSSV